MKKIISLLLVLCLCFALVACGGTGDSSDNGGNKGDAGNTGSNNNPADPGFVFKYNTTEIAMNVKAEPIVTALGEPVSYTEEASCAFSGLDKTYNYGSFVMQTYPDGDVDYVYCLWLVDDSVSTPEGIYIGSAKSEVESAYGADNFNGENAYIITKGASTLTVILDGNVVTSITYDAVLD